MREWGPVYAGSPAGDFTVLTLRHDSGRAIVSHHADIFTYVSPEEIPVDDRTEVVVGLFGRNKRDQDAAELVVIHIEDKRGAA